MQEGPRDAWDQKERAHSLVGPAGGRAGATGLAGARWALVGRRARAPGPACPGYPRRAGPRAAPRARGMARDGPGWIFFFFLSLPPPEAPAVPLLATCTGASGARGAGRGARARARPGPRRSLARGGAGSPRRPPGRTSLQALRERARRGGMARVCGAPHAGPGPEVGGPGGPGAGGRGGRAGRKTSEPCLKGAAGARL